MAREAAGVSMVDAAELLKRDASGISRSETGTFPLPHTDVEALLGLYRVTGDERAALTKLSEEVWRTDWWDGYAGDVERSFVDYVWLESRATGIRSFCITAFDGLLQTPAYARAIVRAAHPAESEQKIERWVELRLQRQAVLERAQPPRISTVVDEAALHRPVGGAAVLAAQLRRLVDQAARPHIEVRILPAAGGAHASPDGAFRIFELTDPYPEVACVESPAGQLYLEPPKSARFLTTYDWLEDAALTPGESAQRMASIAYELEKQDKHDQHHAHEHEVDR